MKRITVLSIALVVALSPLAAAEDHRPEAMSWLALETTKSGKSRDLIGAAIKNDGPMYDELLAAGKLESWGIAIPINHSPDDTFNYMLWATMPSWKEVGDLQAGFQKMFSTRSPEQMAAGQKLYQESTVAGSHHDWIVRHHIRRYAESDVQPQYLVMSYWKAKPGHEEQMTTIFKRSVSPIFDQLLEDGTLLGYGITTQELHTDPTWSHVTWTSISDLSAMGAVDEALKSSLNEVDMAAFVSVNDWGAHRDQVLLIVHLGGTQPQE
jgi:hypothetical protein